MGLMKCPDCGKDVSEHAPACPNCGRPFWKTTETSQAPSTRTTSLTKPAGCFLQVVAPFVALLGLTFIYGSFQTGTIEAAIWGVLIFAAGVWLLIAGGRPGRQK